MEKTLKELRYDHVRREIPDLFNQKTVLYVGAKIKKRWGKGVELLDMFVAEKAEIDIIEVFERNVIALKRFNEEGRNFLNGRVEAGAFRRIIHGNVIDIDFLDGLRPEGYDIAMFWHGPEHLELPFVQPVIRGLEARSNKMTVLGCPWGIYKQGAVGGNEWETHQTALYPLFFEKMGYSVSTIGRRDEKKSNIMAWKRIGKQ